MHIKELKDGLDALKVEVEALKEKGVNEVLAATLQDFSDRITAIENRLTAAGA